MSSSLLTSDNSAIVMIDHAVGFGNAFRSTSTTALAWRRARLSSVSPRADPTVWHGPYGSLFSELRAVTGSARVIVREGNFINAFETPEFAAVVESAGHKKL